MSSETSSSSALMSIFFCVCIGKSGANGARWMPPVFFSRRLPKSTMYSTDRWRYGFCLHVSAQNEHHAGHPRPTSRSPAPRPGSL